MPEVVDRAALVARQRTGDRLKAMVEMVLDQRLFGLFHGLFNRVQLLGNVEAGAACANHLDNGAQVPLRPFQPLDDFRMGLVKVGFGHGHHVSPRRGYGKSQHELGDTLPKRRLTRVMTVTFTK